MIASGDLVLTAVRLWATLRMQTAWHRVAPRTWPWLAPGFAMILAPLVHAHAGAPEPRGTSFVTAVLLELAVGTVIGALASLPGHALVGAATMQAKILASSSSAFVMLVVAIALALGFELGVHHAAIEALTLGVRAWPVGRVPWEGLDAVRLVQAFEAVLVLALALSTPVTLVVAVVDVTTASLGSTPPAAMLSRMAAAVGRPALALVALGASWSADPAAWARAWLP